VRRPETGQGGAKGNVLDKRRGKRRTNEHQGEGKDEIDSPAIQGNMNVGEENTGLGGWGSIFPLQGDE